MTQKEPIRPRFMAVRIDETRHWTGSIADEVKSIHAHYVYDTHQVTNLCSFQVNYWLSFVGFDFVPARELSDEENEELYYRINDEYTAEDNSKYFVCGGIDKITGDDKKVYLEWDDVKDWEAAEECETPKGYNELLHVVVDEWCANPLF